MRMSRQVVFFVSILIFIPYSTRGIGQANSDAAGAEAQGATQTHDGQHDFDFELGAWKIHLKKRLNPLTGSNSWVEFDGTTVTQKVWNGRAEIEQFETEGAAEGLTLRLYRPESHQWYLYWASSKDGILGQPTIGEFKNGVGEFYDQEQFNGRAILVRFIWSAVNSNSPHFEQSFSDDGGKTWEVNWITDQTRISDEKAQADFAPEGRMQASEPAGEGQHDFDFEFGSWKAHLKRLQHPLTGSNTWVEYDGTSIVRKLWNGRANLGELEVGNSTTHIEGLTLRLYDPQSHQWRLYWANSRDGVLSTPTIGQFKNGNGEFFDQEDFQGQAIFVRFVFSGITSTAFRIEQSFSADGGKTWEANWMSEFTR